MAACALKHHSATLVPHSATLVPHSATLVPHSATCAPQRHTCSTVPYLLHGATLVPQPVEMVSRRSVRRCTRHWRTAVRGETSLHAYHPMNRAESASFRRLMQFVVFSIASLKDFVPFQSIMPQTLSHHILDPDESRTSFSHVLSQNET